jgi:hypothetical protein
MRYYVTRDVRSQEWQVRDRDGMEPPIPCASQENAVRVCEFMLNVSEPDAAPARETRSRLVASVRSRLARNGQN